MSTEIAAVLRDAKALIDTPEKWIKGHSRKVVNGVTCHCADGAVWSLTHLDPLDLNYFPAVRALSVAATGRAIADGHVWFNDRQSTTHADVMALFDRAIAAEEAGQ